MHIYLKERESRPMTPEVIDQDYTVLPANRQASMTEKDRKAHAKEEKERIKVGIILRSSKLKEPFLSPHPV